MLTPKLNTYESYIFPNHIYTALTTVEPGFGTKKMLLVWV